MSVLDYDEEYYLTFPNGYGRSILTVPWIELGGTVQITCPKTGKTKSFISFFLVIALIFRRLQLYDRIFNKTILW